MQQQQYRSQDFTDIMMMVMVMVMMGRMMLYVVGVEPKAIATKLDSLVGKVTVRIPGLKPDILPTSATPEVDAFIVSEISQLAAINKVKAPPIQRESIFHLVAWGSPAEVGFSNSWDRVWAVKPDESRRMMKYATAHSFYSWQTNRGAGLVKAIKGGSKEEAMRVRTKAEEWSGVPSDEFKAWCVENRLQEEYSTQFESLKVTPEQSVLISEINREISKRTTYGVREEKVNRQFARKLTWSNAGAEWYFGLLTYKIGDTMVLDANQILVYGKLSDIRSVLRWLDPLPLYKHSFEAKERGFDTPTSETGYWTTMQKESAEDKQSAMMLIGSMRADVRDIENDIRMGADAKEIERHMRILQEKAINFLSRFPGLLTSKEAVKFAEFIYAKSPRVSTVAEILDRMFTEGL